MNCLKRMNGIKQPKRIKNAAVLDGISFILHMINLSKQFSAAYSLYFTLLQHTDHYRIKNCNQYNYDCPPLTIIYPS